MTRHTYPIKKFGAHAPIPSPDAVFSGAFPWLVQRAIADVRFAALKAALRDGYTPLPGRSRFRLTVTVEADVIDTEAVNLLDGRIPDVPETQHWFQFDVMDWKGSLE